MTNHSKAELLEMTTEIVASFVANNPVPAGGLPDLIQSVHETVIDLATDAPAAPPRPDPAVPISKSITPEHIICLEDGKKLKMLKRHLMTAYGMTPEDYRAKWGLKPDYPMVAPNYALKRQELAKKIGLGRKPKTTKPKAKEAPKPRATRAKAQKPAA